MAKIDPKEQARREHNKRVRDGYREYRDDMRQGRKIARDLKGHYADVPVQMIDIIEDIIETQNKKVPLSEFQKEALLDIEKSFKHIHSDELEKPRFVFLKDGSVEIKDMHVLTHNGTPNLTSIGIEGVKRNQALQTVLPLGGNTFEIIELISQTLAENAKLLEQLNKKKRLDAEEENLKYTSLERESADPFENKIMDLEELSITTENTEVSLLLQELFELYKSTKDRVFTPVGERKWLADVPIINVGDRENTSKRAKTVEAITSRHELYELTNKLPDDIKFVQMLPKNVTQKLINILAKAMEENSRLHNELYKKENLQRKFPTKLIALILGAALVAGAIYALTKIDFKDRTVTPNEEVKQEDVLDENIEFKPYMIEHYKEDVEASLDRIKAFGMALGENADDVYADAIAVDSEPYEDYLGDGYENISYSEMVGKFQEVLNELNTPKAKAYIQMLIDKEKAVPRNAPSKTLADYDLTQEEYDNYELLYEHAYDLHKKLDALEEDIRQSQNFQNIVNNSPIQFSERQIAEQLVAMGLGSLVGVAGSLAVAFALMVKQAKKKEKELQQNNEAKADTTTGTNPV